jgi:hypothetical protein|uniref:Uncharacterized protein n=1 Tax=Desulfobacca acetoxidans TaxID=60893 RepID=A0A7C5ELS7_9BACT
MNKMVLIFLAGITLLFIGGLYAGFQVFEPWERLLAEPVPTLKVPGAADTEMTWKGYRKVKLAFGSFDLANGLTKNDLETMSQANGAVGFYFLLASLGLCIGLRALPPRR